MPYVLDTSACLIPSVFSLPSTFKTTQSVLYELDYLKSQPRTRRRQQEQLYNLFYLFTTGSLHIVDTYVIPPADDHLLEILTQDDVLLTQDFQLYFRQLVNGFEQRYVNEELPEHVQEPVKHVEVDVPLDGDKIETKLDIPDNTYVFVTNKYSSRIGNYQNGSIRFIKNHKLMNNIQDVQPQCQEQRMLVDQILSPTTPLVICMGPAGSGKTILALAQQYHLIYRGQYEHIVMAQPPVQLGGRDRYGYFPGRLEEKAQVYLQGIEDNLTYLFGAEGQIMLEKQKAGTDTTLQIQSFANLRGRSIKSSLIIVDEAQNASAHELKTIITRIDKDSKLILLGDIEQIDIKKRGIEDNGLLYVQDRMYFSDAQQVIKLVKTYRSYLAEEQIRLL